MASYIGRRKFLATLGGAAATWPLAARAQQAAMPVVGFVRDGTFDVSDDRVTAFRQGLKEAGFIEGQNVAIEYRSDQTDSLPLVVADLLRRQVALIVGNTPSALAAKARTTTVPIVFTLAIDPVGGGWVDSLAQPGRNATGFTSYEYSLTAKWLELLKEIAPGVTRVAVLRDANSPQGVGQFAVLQSVASTLSVELRPLDVSDPGEIERGITAFTQTPNGGLIVTGSSWAFVHRDLIIALAARHRLPAVYFQHHFVAGGGLISYAPDDIEPHRRAAGYVDRILRGEKPADLPVQASTKYRLAINLKAAKALGLEVPPTLLARADEVIE